MVVNEITLIRVSWKDMVHRK